MTEFLIVVGVIIVGVIVSKIKPIDNQAQISAYTQSQILEKSAQKSTNRVTRDYAYYNHFKIYCGEYDHISPSEAKRRVERMRESGNWNNDKYHDLQNRAFSKMNDQRLRDVETLEGEDLRAYFDDIFTDDNDYVTAAVMQSIFEKLSQYDESHLLSELEKLPLSEASSWVNTKKSEGFFFTEKVYTEAWNLRQQYLKNLQKRL